MAIYNYIHVIAAGDAFAKYTRADCFVVRSATIKALTFTEGTNERLHRSRAAELARLLEGAMPGWEVRPSYITPYYIYGTRKGVDFRFLDAVSFTAGYVEAVGKQLDAIRKAEARIRALALNLQER